MTDKVLNNASHDRWQFWIDRGGTFTDVIGYSPDGRLTTEKLLSDNPQAYSDAAPEGIRRILGISASEAIPADRIECVKIGTTVATNALLERTGEPTVLVINKGFGDALRIAYQNRPDIFARRIILPEQLYSRVLEIDCRFDAVGTELAALNDRDVRAALQAVFDEGWRSCAIVLMHGYKFIEHERRISQIASDIGFTQVSASHEVSPLLKLVSRGDTTVADAYLSPVLKRYIATLQKELPGIRLLFMQSNGGLADSEHFHGKDSLLSGPAGGAVGAASCAAQSGFDKLISFDMGGTSTDVSHYAGSFERTTASVVAGVRIRAPMIAIHTVAAGGGSICSFDGFRLRVGPNSAGAAPGPACYRKGGPLTVTDCNLLLGRLQPSFFPAIFGARNDQPLDLKRVKELFEELCQKINRQSKTPKTPDVVAQDFLSIAAARMAAAIKQISIEKGHDVSSYVLVSFGGAGGQHACQIADLLGITRILIHPLAGVLSAFGIGTAKLTCIKHAAVELPLKESNLPYIKDVLAQLALTCRNTLGAQTTDAAAMQFEERLALRYDGTDTSIAVPFATLPEMQLAFDTIHRERFGFLMPDKQVVVESAIVESQAEAVAPNMMPDTAMGSGRPAARCRLYCAGWKDAELWQRQDLAPEQILNGPSIIIDKTSTTIVETDWQAQLDKTGALILSRTHDRNATGTEIHSTEAPDPAHLELFNHIFMSTAEQMGAALQSTSHSINIKERLDFSCAIFNQNGNLVANAPHIPVHLGSMSECVQKIIQNRRDKMRRGESYATNNPYAGGTHLPDITVVSPVFAQTGDTPVFFVASRGHHADVGGITPGSMPSNSTLLEEEGVVIDDYLLVSDGQFREDALRRLLNSSKYPARNPSQNIADLKAQVAANVRGTQALLNLVQTNGLATVQRYMQFVQENSELAVRTAIAKLRNGKFTCKMDNGSTICVSITIDHATRSAIIDFEGTSKQLATNLNAPPSITKAAVMYVFRTLVDDDIPLNDGFLVPLSDLIPPDCLLNPKYPAAIVAGNVETSQQITDALYGALGVMAASQGTMNNFTFGDKDYQYYETIAGGSGAGADFDGTSAVQTNMTNSRLTDPEVLELRYPVIVKEFAIRENSGGIGEHSGGDGVIRKIYFQKSMTASILSQRRRVAPFGLNGGQDASAGHNFVIRQHGELVQLGATDTIDVFAGDTFVIETPGGGGFGAAKSD